MEAQGGTLDNVVKINTYVTDIRYRADLSHSGMLQQIKARSSKWIHEAFPQLADFAWQEGYGGFTVSTWPS